MKLYEITQEMEALEQLWELAIDEETGELLPEADELFKKQEMLEKMLRNKSEGLMKYMLELQSNIKIRKEEENRLAKLRKSDEKKLSFFTQYILSNMQKMNIGKIETNFGIFKINKGVQTVIDENIIPKDERYWKEEIVNKFDKTVLKKLLKENERIDGVSLVETYSLGIK